jgi:hypothetical protein
MCADREVIVATARSPGSAHQMKLNALHIVLDQPVSRLAVLNKPAGSCSSRGLPFRTWTRIMLTLAQVLYKRVVIGDGI